MDTTVQRIHNRRRRRPPEKFQFAVNTTATILLGVPMIVESLKELMPPRFYGVTSSVAALLNMGIGVWRLHVQRGDVRVN
ncbi:MAG: hypothetical protein H0T60_15760 [Acidobacteria bacterium]|nr:hypothetical protein [Acidobacteriota bacterium]